MAHLHFWIIFRRRILWYDGIINMPQLHYVTATAAIASKIKFVIDIVGKFDDILLYKH